MGAKKVRMHSQSTVAVSFGSHQHDWTLLLMASLLLTLPHPVQARGSQHERSSSLVERPSRRARGTPASFPEPSFTGRSLLHKRGTMLRFCGSAGPLAAMGG